MLKYRLILFSFFLSIHSWSQHSFEIKSGQFVYDGKPILIHSGEMHFARVPKPYWRHRLQMLKAMGLNTVATYVFWNYHNPAPGVPFNGVLDILVENMGRINYGALITQNEKGIISPVLINNQEITGNWEMYPLPFDRPPVWKMATVARNEQYRIR
jgi:beta-galactosidase GanA